MAGATARQLEITKEQLESSGGSGGAYAALEVPKDYQAVLVGVEDYDKRSEGKTWGWVFKYEIQGLAFDTYLSFSPGARWKIIEVMEAHEADLSEGINEIDPNAFVGEYVGTHVDFPRDDDGEPTSNYREIRYFFPLGRLEDDNTQETVKAEEPEVI